jgi:hypothetical protein
MFIGHFALAFGAKKLLPNASLGTLFLAVQLADLVWSTFVLSGIETLAVREGVTAFTPLDFIHYPYSHSLAALLLWALAFAALHKSVVRRNAKVSLVLIALVLSHWCLDVLSHRPDMQLAFSGPERYGLGLWNSVSATIVVEAALLAIGLSLYLNATKAIDRVGNFGLWVLLIFLVIAYLASAFGPLPPSSAAVAWSAQAMWLLVAWAYWVDRHRTSHVTTDV